MLVHYSLPKQYTEFIFVFQKLVQILLFMKFFPQVFPFKTHPVDLEKSSKYKTL